MPDFSSLLRMPAGEHKRPALLPAGPYPGVLKSYEMGESSQKKTPYVRFHIGLLGFPSNVTSEEQQGIDLSKRQLRTDFYFTEDALYRLDEVITGLGIAPNGRSYEEILPEMVGHNVQVDVVKELNQQSNEQFNSVKRIAAG